MQLLVYLSINVIHRIKQLNKVVMNILLKLLSQKRCQTHSSIYLQYRTVYFYIPSGVQYRSLKCVNDGLSYTSYI